MVKNNYYYRNTYHGMLIRLVNRIFAFQLVLEMAVLIDAIHIG